MRTHYYITDGNQCYNSMSDAKYHYHFAYTQDEMKRYANENLEINGFSNKGEATSHTKVHFYYDKKAKTYKPRYERTKKA